jgi:hypothetical protein
MKNSNIWTQSTQWEVSVLDDTGRVLSFSYPVSSREEALEEFRLRSKWSATKIQQRLVRCAEATVMSYTNQFILGATQKGYAFFNPPKQAQSYTDEEMLELAAMIVAMKPNLRDRFNEILAQVMSGE